MNDIITQNELFKFAKTLKILYVEDNEETREFTLDVFDYIFNDIVLAIDGEDGFTKYDNSIDLIITDINMPKLNGIEMIKKIKEKNSSVSIMIVSAHNDTSFFTQSIEIGIDGYLLKPINNNTLNRSLLKVLEKIYLTKELQNHKDMLEQKVHHQIKELQKKDEALAHQNKLASMGEIIDIVAHQWKQPLNIVSLKTNFLEEFYDDEDCVDIKKVRKCNKDVSLQIRHLVNTLDEFRGFLRPNTNISVCNLSKLILSVKTLLKDDLIKNNILLNISCANDIEINSNSNDIKHIFISLISNTKDAFNSQNITNRTIDINATQNHLNTTIEIQDNAGGIPEDIKGSIFKPNVTSKKESGGTGMGLYMVKMIIDKYNGNINVENKNEGVCFTLNFKNRI
jgi:signal transduction histidine kinase